MGACQFGTTQKGASMQEAFLEAVKEAQYNYGHSGYRGTIANKDGFIDIAPVPEGMTPVQWIATIVLISEKGAYPSDDPTRMKLDPAVERRATNLAVKFDDKWGPALGIKISDDEYHFFGWAPL